MTSGERDGGDNDSRDRSGDYVPVAIDGSAETSGEPPRIASGDEGTVTMTRSAVVSVRDALLRGDAEAAYHALLGGIDPSFVEPEPWKTPVVDDEDESATSPSGRSIVVTRSETTIDGIVTRLGVAANAYRDVPGGSAVVEAEKALSTIVSQIRIAGCEIVCEAHEVVGVRNARAEDLERTISGLDMRVRRSETTFLRLAAQVDPPLDEAGVWTGDIVEAVGAEKAMLTDRIAHLERIGADRPARRGATSVDWWSDRIPREGESEEEAIRRLHRSPGYGGSLEDARCAVYDAMDKARMVATAPGDGA